MIAKHTLRLVHKAQTRSFARSIKTTPKTETSILKQTPAKQENAAKTVISTADQLKLQEEIKTVDSLSSVKDCFLLAEKSPVLHRTSRQLLLVRMSHLADPTKKSEKGDRLLNKESFLSLLSHIRSDFASDSITNNTRLTILQALLRLKLPD